MVEQPAHHVLAGSPGGTLVMAAVCKLGSSLWQGGVLGMPWVSTECQSVYKADFACACPPYAVKGQLDKISAELNSTAQAL